jgi:hypothetical protein
MIRCQWPDGCERHVTDWLFSVERDLEGLCDTHKDHRVAEWGLG